MISSNVFKSFLFVPLTILKLFSVETEKSSDLGRLENSFQVKEKDFLKIIQSNPRSIRGWSGRGDMRLFLGDFEGAKSDYEKMIQLDPSLEVSHWRLGIAYFYLKEYENLRDSLKFITITMQLTGKTEFGASCPNSKAKD